VVQWSATRTYFAVPSGPVESLVPLERFLKAAASVPRVEAKLECGIIMRSFKCVLSSPRG
jgi:hypothetical protein